MLDNTIDDTWSLTKAELAAVFDKAERGSMIVYAFGDLFMARQIDQRWEDTGEYAYKLYCDGEGYLTQERHGVHRYEYRIEKR